MRYVLAGILAVALVGCAGESTPLEPGPVTDDPIVSLENVSFTPAVVTVRPGTTVTWEWNDGSLEHDVVFDDFASEIMASGTFTHTFEEPGTYEYVCSLHSNMKGTVFVVDSTR